jgi:hypothetical protein
MAKSKKQLKSKKNTKRNNRKTVRKIKGGCGCNTPLITGGNHPPSFDKLPIRYFYDMNTHDNDPNNPNVMESSRNLPNPSFGGKKSKKRKQKRIKGGNNDVFLGNTPVNNAFTSFGSIDGAFSGKNLLLGIPNESSSVTEQPAYQFFNKANPPLA